MNDGGVSKKLAVTTTCVSGVLGLAANAEDPLPFAIIIGIMFVSFLACQVLMDWFKK